MSNILRVRLTLEQALQVMGEVDEDGNATRESIDSLRRALKAENALRGGGRGRPCWTTIHELARLRLVSHDPIAERQIRAHAEPLAERIEELGERIEEQGAQIRTVAEVVGETSKRVSRLETRMVRNKAG